MMKFFYFIIKEIRGVQKYWFLFFYGVDCFSDRLSINKVYMFFILLEIKIFFSFLIYFTENLSIFISIC